jgi:hypothetical protein
MNMPAQRLIVLVSKFIRIFTFICSVVSRIQPTEPAVTSKAEPVPSVRPMALGEEATLA